MTLKEIAKMAGVSSAAVSLVLNNKPGVSPEKRLEIQELLIKHNYNSPKNNVQAPAKQLLFLKYIKNGFLVEDNIGFVASILDSVEAECRQDGYLLRIEVSHNSLEETLKNTDFSLLNGIFVLGTELDASAYPLLSTIPVPYVVIDNRMPFFPCNAVTMNNEEMVYHAIRHLASLGFHEIGYFKSRISIQNFEDRAAAFYQACRHFDLTCSPEHIFEVDPFMMGAYASMKEHLQQQHTLPPCIFADNDTIALGAMKALQEFGYKIPEDICIIGFDDIVFSAVNSPSLTTMQVSKKQIGQMAVRALTAAMQHPNDFASKQYVDGTLIRRHSTRP